MLPERAIGYLGLAPLVLGLRAGVAVWCAAARFPATRQVAARLLSRWGHLLLPVVLVGWA